MPMKRDKLPVEMTKPELLNRLREVEAREENLRRQAGCILEGFKRMTEWATSCMRVAVNVPDGECGDVLYRHISAMQDSVFAERMCINLACIDAGIDRPKYDDRPAEEVL